MVKPTRNLREIKALLYRDNITQYLIEFQKFNDMVQLDSQAMKKMVARAVPKTLIELVYSRHGIVPLDNLGFITVVQDTSFTYKSFLL